MVGVEIPDDLTHASFFFVDIVGLSNPILSTETQKTKVKILNESIYKCHEFALTPRENMFVLPTGDGMLIGFKNDLEKPIKLAIELQHTLKKYNQSVPDTENVSIRIGCNIGHIFVVRDVFGNTNLWGPGAILARRVMDLGDENHVLVTASMAEDLIDISEKYEKILHPIHSYTIKHNEEILVYNAYDFDFGNKEIPKKTMLSSDKTIKEPKNTILSKKIIFNLKMESMETNLIKHERVYHFVNISAEPIYQFDVDIITNSEIGVDGLKLGIFDENNNELKIIKITSISPLSKQITVKLTTPVFNDGKEKTVRLIYETSESEKCFESIFLVDSQYFEINCNFQHNFLGIIPKLTHINCIQNSKNRIEGLKIMSKESLNKIQWKKTDGIIKNDMIHLVW